MIFIRIVFLSLVFVLACSRSAIADIQLHDEQPNELASQFEFTFNKASVESVLQLTQSWEKNGGDRVSIGFTEEPVWFRTQLYNPTDNKHWYLTLSNTRLDYIEFYLVTDHGIQKGLAGDRLAQTLSSTAKPTFKFTLDNNTSAHLLIRVASDSQIAFYSTIRSSFNYGEYQAYLKHLHFFYIALFLVFTLYQFSMNRTPISAMNFYYSAGLLFAFLHIFIYYGEGNAVLWPNSAYLKNHIHFVAASLSFMCFTLFLQCYLRTKVSTPNFHKLFRMFSTLCGFFAIAMLFPIPNIIMVHIMLVESAIISILAVVGTFRCIQVGNRWAIGLAIPLVFSVIALIVYALTFLGLLPYTQFTSKLILWSLPLDIIMVSGSFVHRHLQLQKENRLLLENLNRNTLQTDKFVKPSVSRLNNIDEEKTLSELVEFLDTKKAYLESGLTLDDVAEAIDVRSDQLSAVINSRLNTSFSTLLNLKRLDAAAKLLIAEKETSILDVSLRCGFGSKSSFNRLFKEQFDTTPTQYRKIIHYNHNVESC